MAELIEYKCPCCSAKIEWNSAAQKMKCPYCDSEFDISTLQAYDDALSADDAPAGSDWQESAGGEWRPGEAEGMRVYSCKTCGGQVIADETTAASQCPYCGNPVIMAGNFSGALRPDLVIPFKLDKAAAKRALSQHMEGKPLLPKIFKSQNHIDEIKGVYVPVWLYDAEADAHLRWNATKVRTWRDQQYEYTETSHYTVTRAGTIAFEHVPVDGSSKMDDTVMESLEPFDYREAVPFATAYLSGYLADKYDVDADASRARADTRIRNSTLQSFAQTVQGYSATNLVSDRINLTGGKAQYALYPVWMLSTSWNGKNYSFAMNGQSGRFVGDLPADKGKAAGIFCGVTAGTGLLVYLLTVLLSEAKQGNLMIALIAALIVGGITIAVLLGQLHSVAPKNTASNYIAENSLNLTQKDDLYTHTTTERRALPQMPKNDGTPGGGGNGSGLPM